MNRRQAQRWLAELISKCEAAHIQLPEDPLEARAEAVEAIIHSLADGKTNLGDAQEELQQKFGLELVWKQHIENEEAKRQRRRQSHQKKVPSRAKDPRLVKNLGSLTESPPVDDSLETGDNKELQQGAEGRKSSTTKMGVMTPSKRPIATQESTRGDGGVKIAKKAKSARGVIVPKISSDTEEKPPPLSGRKSGAGLGNIVGNDNSTGSPDQGIVDLLDLEDLEDADGGSGSAMSSDEEFAL
ncbi:hypothetical protein PF008_g4999 [Phytophthora fragariae]|uniref:Uncharacterized protein n=1 Tax=Phytophthora fragariae TaxID=53985 RepID=A0A6G0SAB0_9STRA|nr:hypothetical protein PF008_g4999 [Phytophthora fragariae]